MGFFIQNLPFSSLYLKKLPKRAKSFLNIHTELGINIFANIAIQKTNSASDDAARISRYKDIHQRAKIKTNEISFITRQTQVTGKNPFSVADNIRPPSNPIIGIRLRIHRENDDITNSESKEKENTFTASTADKKLKSGPPTHRIISSLYE